MIAHADESVHASRRLYVVGAVRVPVRDCVGVRGAVQGLLLSGQQRFHWRHETEPQRSKMFALIRDSGLVPHAYICTDMGPRQERARVRCLKRLLWDLMGDGVGGLMIESRQIHNDKLDRILIVAAQRAGGASPTLSYGWNIPVAEPLLWLGDALAGAAADNALDGRYEDELAEIGFNGISV